MPRYSRTLENYIHKMDYKLSKISVYNIGLQLLRNLETIHAAGFVYNDMKLDNIMMNFSANPPKSYIESNCFKDI